MPTLVQRLANSQDADVRNRAMGTMREYLRDDLDELAMRKLWRAIFFAMWLCDLAPVQHELAERVASLIQSFSALEAACRWIGAFCTTILSEWDKLDKYRVDKFYVLLRLVIRNVLIWGAWSQERLAALSATLDDGILSRSPNGPRLHACDVLLDEIMVVAGKTPYDSIAPIATLLAPFLKLLRKADATVFTRIADRIVSNLVECSDLPLADDLRTWLQPQLYEIAADASICNTKRPALYAVLKKLVARTGLPLSDPIKSSCRPDRDEKSNSALKRRHANTSAQPQSAALHKRRRLALVRKLHALRARRGSEYI